MRWLLRHRARESGAQIVERSVECVHHLLEALLAAEVGGSEEVGEVVVWMAGI